jgi:cytochrome c553
MNRLPASFSAAAVAALATLALAGLAQADPKAGRAKAQLCAACHGPLGVAVAPDAPNLAGQSEIYLTAQLQAYRSGRRQHEVMGVIAKPLSDDDIRDLAAWFASLQIEVREKP